MKSGVVIKTGIWSGPDVALVEVIDDALTTVWTGRLAKFTSVDISLPSGDYSVRLRIPNGPVVHAECVVEHGLRGVVRLPHWQPASSHVVQESATKFSLRRPDARLWIKLAGMAWKSEPVREKPHSESLQRVEWSIPFSTADRFLQLEATNEGWASRLIAIPNSGGDVVVAFDGPPRLSTSERLRLSLVGYDPFAEALLAYESSGELCTAAKLIKSVTRFDELTALARIVVGYFLLEQRSLDRFDALYGPSEVEESSSDVAIQQCWRFIRYEQDLAQAEVQLTKALRSGLPLFTSGVVLLDNAIKLFKDQSGDASTECERAHSWIDNYLTEIDWSVPFTSFCGVAPDRPGRNAKTSVKGASGIAAAIPVCDSVVSLRRANHKRTKLYVEKQLGASRLSIETGLLAMQAAGSCVVRYGDIVVLTAAADGPPRPGFNGFFLLTCDYRERAAAAGKFPSGFLKREGRPTTKETLTSRLMDRPIRPLFPSWFHDEVQIQSFVMASDRKNDADVLAMNGASAALGLSPLPFEGPIGSVRLGHIGGQFVPFPTQDDLKESDLDLVVSGSKDEILMIEGFAREMPEDRMLEALREAHCIVRQICDLQSELYQKANVEKRKYEVPPDDGLYEKLKGRYYDALRQAKQTSGKQAVAEAVANLKAQVLAEMIPDPLAEGAIDSNALGHAWHALEERIVRDLILAGTRPDGRDAKTLRDIECHVDVLPRVHGSAVFQRGETQALITVTLGTGRDEQRVDGLIDEYSKKFMLDYNFPSFSVGEVRPIRGPGRREIGHGALAERSMTPVLPDPETFPYTVRVISDILESNGSSSMASVCGATLGLMAAGVPITNPVAGISVGLVKESNDWTLLTDIIGDEDHFGDMDFKIAGTQNGITGIQLDLKINGISEEIVKATMAQSREARIEILRKMLTTISRPKADISMWAPRLLRTHIPPDKIGALIGPGGKTIRAIQESTGAVLEIDDNGTVTIASADGQSAQAALTKVEALTASVQVGRIYHGRVTSVKDFGAFVEIIPGKDGLCHISELADDYVNSVADICRVGDEIAVKVISVDDQDRVKLSRRGAMTELNKTESDE